MVLILQITMVVCYNNNNTLQYDVHDNNNNDNNNNDNNNNNYNNNCNNNDNNNNYDDNNDNNSNSYNVKYIMITIIVTLHDMIKLTVVVKVARKMFDALKITVQHSAT